MGFPWGHQKHDSFSLEKTLNAIGIGTLSPGHLGGALRPHSTWHDVQKVDLLGGAQNGLTLL